MVQFRESAPKFHAEYKTARRIVDSPATQSGKKAESAKTTTEKAVTQKPANIVPVESTAAGTNGNGHETAELLPVETTR